MITQPNQNSSLFVNEQPQQFQQEQQFVQDPYAQIPPPASGLRIDNEFVKSLYESTGVLGDIEDVLYGRVRDSNGNYQAKGKPIMKEEGVALLMGDLRIHMNKFSSFLTSFGIDSVNRIAKECRLATIKWIFLNWDRFDIELSNFDRIVLNVDHAIFGSLMKSLNDGERKHMFQSFRFGEQLNDQVEKKKKWGFF